jgi:type IV pilus assembly protein PilA
MFDTLLKVRDEKLAKAREDGGFTLIELLVVVVIIGILIAIAIPLYLNYQKGAHDKSAQSDLRAAVSAMQQCFTDNGNSYPASLSFSGSVGTPSAAGCANDKVNTSSGTTLTYAPAPTGCTDSTCTSFVLTAYNSGGNRGSGNPYTYNSTAGGTIG